MFVLRNWRAGVLLLLLAGPVAVYAALGALWLFEHRLLLWAGLAWLVAGIIFSLLAARWTRSERPVLPPIDWDAPATFARIDREAWALVEEEAEKGENASLDRLIGADIYIDTGRRLARRLAEHYHPDAESPIERVPVIELLTALELAAEDLTQLCKQVPGGDLITPSHWKKAVTVANYLQRANDIYGYLLPIFSPVNGLVRLGTQQWMVKPAWKNMQQNLLHWFYRAYVNRLGTHLIELYSGRLAIGADRYRRLTRRAPRAAGGEGEELPPLRIAVAGARDSGKSRLLELVALAREGQTRSLAGRLADAGIDPSAFERLKVADWFEVPGYTCSPGGETARDRSTRREAVEQAVEADMLILVIDARRDTTGADAAFARDWDRWYIEHPAIEAPPALAVLTGMDAPDLGGDWRPPYNWAAGHTPREVAARAKVTALRTALPPSVTEVVAVGLPETNPFGVAELVLPALATLAHRAERAALIRHLQEVSSRSKAGRLMSQVGERGRWLWNNIRRSRGQATTAGDS